MRMAFLTPSLPWPANSGGKIKTYKMLEYLAKSHQIDLYIIQPSEDLHCLKEFETLFPSIVVHHVVGSKTRNLKNLLLSYLFLKPLSVYRNFFSPLAALIENNCSLYDLIFVDHFLMFQYVPKLCRAKILVHQHNAEFVMWERYAALLPLSLKKLAVQLEAKRIRSYELELCQRADVVMAAPNDCQALQSLSSVPFPFVETLHLADEALLDLPRHFSSDSSNLLYVGTLSWEANWDGLRWFLDHVWPLLIDKYPSVKLQIVGKASVEQQQMLANYQRVEVLGFVDNLDLLFNRARCFIAPLRFGSGIKVKVVEALYRGMAIVTTSIGAEGIGLTDGENVFIADSATTQVTCISKLIDDPAWAQDMATKARDHAVQHLRWTKVFENLEKAICRSSTSPT